MGLRKLNIKNVILKKPVSREKIIEIYNTF